MALSADTTVGSVALWALVDSYRPLMSSSWDTSLSSSLPCEPPLWSNSEKPQHDRGFDFLSSLSMVEKCDAFMCAQVAGEMSESGSPLLIGRWPDARWGDPGGKVLPWEPKPLSSGPYLHKNRAFTGMRYQLSHCICAASFPLTDNVRQA